jgi:DNA-binding transcriptional LysR family regulator
VCGGCHRGYLRRPQRRRGSPRLLLLHVSTARVSQTIKKLERRIGAALFERTSRQVALTPIGRRLDDDLRPAYQQIREGIGRAIAVGRGVEGVVRVGFIGTAVGQFLHQVAETFHARHPACQVQIREARYSDFLDRPIERGADFSTVQEMLSLIGAGKGIFPVPAHARRYDTRPDITYVPIRDGLPRERRLTWRTTAECSRIRAFNQTVRDLVHARANPLLDPDPLESEGRAAVLAQDQFGCFEPATRIPAHGVNNGTNLPAARPPVWSAQRSTLRGEAQITLFGADADSIPGDRFRRA